MSPHQPWASGLEEIRFQGGVEGFSREALSELLENVPLAVAVTLGPEHHFAFANRLLRSALSLTPDGLIGRAARAVLGKHYTPEISALTGKIFETGLPQELKDVPWARPLESTTYWDIKLLPVRGADSRINGILTLAANVTERVRARSEADLQAREAALHNERLALAVEATELGLWEWNAQTGDTFWSERQRQIFGLGKDEPASYEFWLSAIHPEDRDYVVGSVGTLSDPRSGGQLRLEHRIVRPDGEIRWIDSRGRMLYEIVDGELKPARLLGTILDITERRRGDEVRQLLVQELDHRVKNLFAMTSGMVALTAKTAVTPREMAKALQGRIEALARAHELIRPAIAGIEPAGRTTSIDQIVHAVLAPHIDHGSPSRIALEGAPAHIGPKAATTLTLVLHELATNAVKYGSLSVPEGHLRVSWTCGGNLALVWTEESGPPIVRTPELEGFGSLLSRKSVTDQLGGAIVHEWRAEGLQVRIDLPFENLNA